MEDIVVVKFGGSSLADGTQFSKVKKIIEADKKRRYIVPSAPGKGNSEEHKVTDLLYMCHQLSSHGLNFDEIYSIIERRFLGICRDLKLEIGIEQVLKEIKEDIRQGASRDYCGSRGEYINGIILSEYLGFEFIDAKKLIKFKENGEFHGQATEVNVREGLGEIPYAVIPGFYGSKPNGDILTFSRGGSDITGSIIASAVKANLYENWTDVSGFLMADPKIVDRAKSIERITYKELRELSYMGAPVLHEEAIFPIKNSGIPIVIKNTNSPNDIGTIIEDDDSEISYAGTITGVAGKKNFTAISVEKVLMSRDKGFYRKLISVFETNNVTIEHMPSSIDSITVIVSNSELNSKLDKIVEEIKIYCNPDNVVCYKDMALIAIVGRGMIKTRGISAKVFTALAQGGVNIRMISQGSSELNIIVGVKNGDFEKAIASIYKAFEKNGGIQNEKS